MTAVNELSKVL